MMKAKLFGLAVLAASAIAAPAMAQMATTSDPGMRNSSTDTSYRQRRVVARQDRNQDRNWNRTQTGFWPADAAGDVADVAVGTAGAAVATAGAIATAPFRAWDNSYAYDNSWDNRGWDNRGWDTRTYAQRNGFVCTPGTWIKGDDGRRHICQ